MEKQNVPALRFPEFDEPLKRVALQELVENGRKIRYGIVQPGKFDPNGRFMIRGQDYSSVNGWGETSDFFRVSPEVEKKYKKARVKSGDLLITIVGAGTGWMEVVPDFLDGANITQTTGRIAVDESKASSIFVRNYFLSFFGKKEIYKYIKGQAQPGLNIGDIEVFQLKVPSLSEQQKIASFLSAVDKKIEQLSRKKALMEEYKKGVMQRLFPHSGEQHPELRFKQDDGSDFPDWEVSKLGELTKKVGKKNKENIPYPIYSINNQEGFLPQEDQFEGLNSVDRGYDISMYKIIHPNTFAYNPARINVGSIGYSYDLDKVIISSLYVCFQTKKNLSDQFLLSYLDTHQFKNFVLRYQEGGVRQYLFYENFSAIKIPLPSIPEQLKISNFLSKIDDRISKQEEKIRKAQSFKKGLLQQMFV